MGLRVILGWEWFSKFESEFQTSMTLWKAYNMDSPNYGSYQKSVNTKVIPFNELNNIAIEHFPLKWIFVPVVMARMLIFDAGRPRFLLKLWWLLRKRSILEQNVQWQCCVKRKIKVSYSFAFLSKINIFKVTGPKGSRFWHSWTHARPYYGHNF